jgi:predicted DNA binding protein
MLREISLEVNAENKLQEAARAHGARLTVVDCKAFNNTGITLLLEMRGDAEAVRSATTEIRRVAGVRQVVEGKGESGVNPLLVVLDRPPICRASNDAAIVCLDCPLNADTQPSSWRFIARRTSDFRQILAHLERDGIETRIENVAPLERKPTLTGRQKEILATAVARGYFEFPRKISLTGLSELVGVKPSTLSEILRSAERRIMASAVGAPFQEEV